MSLTQSTLALTAVLFLAACGGGGGATTETPPAPPAPEPTAPPPDRPPESPEQDGQDPNTPPPRPVAPTTPVAPPGAPGGTNVRVSVQMVAGGLALMKQAFRGQLTPRELVRRLMDTADNTGIYTDPDIYGAGVMDLNAATSPIGGLATGTPGLQAPLAETRLATPAAWGDVGARVSGEFGAFDAWNAPFWQPLETVFNPPGRTGSGPRSRKTGRPRRISSTRSPGGTRATSGSGWRGKTGSASRSHRRTACGSASPTRGRQSRAHARPGRSAHPSRLPWRSSRNTSNDRSGAASHSKPRRGSGSGKRTTPLAGCSRRAEPSTRAAPCRSSISARARHA